MLLSGVSSAYVVAVVALLNSDNAVLSELTEVSRQLHSAGSRLAQWHAASAAPPIVAVPDGPTCPYCGEGSCRVCHDTACAYDESCGNEGKIAAQGATPSEALATVARHAVAAVGEAVDRIRVAAQEVLTIGRGSPDRAVTVAEEPDSRMGCDFLPGCDFGWTSQPDWAAARDVVAAPPRAPEPPADEEAMTPAPVAPAIANLAGPDPFDALFPVEPTPAERQNTIRPVLFAAANLMARLAEAADSASERLYYLAGDETPPEGD